MMKRRILAPAALCLLPLLGGCLLSPRDPAPPKGDQEGSWIVPIRPKQVFLNLASGLAAAGNSNYERSLAEDFTFIPLDQDELQFPGAFEGWTKAVEMDVLNNIKGEYQGGRSAQFGDENQVFPREDVVVGRAEFEGPYRWTLDHGDGGEPEVYSATARFYLREGTAGWVIYKWEEIEVIGTYPTSGNLRGTSRPAG